MLSKNQRYQKEQISQPKKLSIYSNFKNGNETQLPLSAGCFKGQYQVSSFSQVKSFQNIIESLNSGIPIISAFRLSPNFYRNNGTILLKNASKGGQVDSHAAGHAVLLIGYMKIPKELNEGDYCIVMANSWGVGWGQGGHACISEKWFKHFRYDISFLAVNSLK